MVNKHSKYRFVSIDEEAAELITEQSNKLSSTMKKAWRYL